MKNEPSNGLEKLIRYVRDKFWTWFICIITLSFVGLVVSSFIFDKIITLSVISNWVGVILGLVALVATVFSLGLSFYNFDKQNEIEDKNREIMNSILRITTETQKQFAQFSLQHEFLETDSQKNKDNKESIAELKHVSELLNSLITNNGGKENE